MGVDFKEAFTYEFKDSSWKLKLAVLTAVTFISGVLAVIFREFIINMIFFIFLAGFNVLLTNNLIKNTDPILPELNIKNIYKQGVKIFGIFFIIIFSYIVIMILFTLITSIIAIMGRFYPNLNVNLIMMIESGIVFISVLLMLLVMPFMQLLFSENFSFTAALNIKKCLIIFIKNWSLYVLLFFLFFIINIPLGSFQDIAFIFDNKSILIPVLLLSSIISAFLSFAYTNLMVQVYKQSIAKMESNDDNAKLESIKHKFNVADYKIIALMVFIPVSVIIVMCHFTISENSSLGRIFALVNHKTPTEYRLHHYFSCQSDRYRLNKPELFPVIKNGKMGYIDKTGKIAIEPKFAYADDFYDGLALVNIGGEDYHPTLYSQSTVGGKYGFIDTKGNFVIKPIFDKAFRFNDANVATVKIGDKYKYIDRSGKYVPAAKNNNTVIFNNSLAKYGRVSDFVEGIAIVEKNKKMGAINNDGQMVIDTKYDYLSDFREGLAIVAVNNKFGYINKKGEIVIQPQFDDACNFSEGFADANVNNKVGYIDKTGHFVMKPQYDGNFGFINGIAPVFVNGKWGYIDKNGNYIWKPTI